jgi:hypothetical protein
MVQAAALEIDIIKASSPIAVSAAAIESSLSLVAVIRQSSINAFNASPQQQKEATVTSR